MVTGKSVSEASLLMFSFCMGVFFTALGVGWGLAISSGVVLFDGIYSGMSIILTMLSIIAMRLVNQPDDSTFQFGRMALEPLVVAFKSIVIICVCIYGAVVATSVILDGGERSTDSTGGMLYGVVSIAACSFSWYYLKLRGAGMPDLVKAESEQWLMDTVLSAVVLASFIVSYFVAMTDHADLVPFIDPSMVVLGSCYFVRVPALRLVKSVRELLQAAPEPTIQHQLTEHVEAVAAAHAFPESMVRASKIGRELAVDITFISGPDYPPVDLADLDRIRHEVVARLEPLDLKLWVNIVFTKDRRWA